MIITSVSRPRRLPEPAVAAAAAAVLILAGALPVSNLTNLLAFSMSGLTLTGFTALMALPWLAAIAVEYAGFRLFFAADLAASPARSAAAPGQDPPPGREPGRQPGVPVFALVTVAATLAGFVAASAAGISPAWAALAGGCVLAARELGRPGLTAVSLARAASPAFLLFVLALGLVVEAVRRQHRPQPELPRLAGEPALAPDADCPRLPGRRRRVHPAGPAHRPGRGGAGDRGPVGGPARLIRAARAGPPARPCPP
ncbi:MAG TPA: hypothetical protein VH637_09450 [Streptosporangiaceae bacterium]